jgi:peptide deformylase
MARLPLKIKGDTVLSTVSKPVSVSAIKTPKIQNLIDDMIETMKKEKGVGIAAPQVGVNERVIIVDVDGDIDAYINPKIFSASDSLVESEEGCLSVPGTFGIVMRSDRVKVKALDRNGLPVRLSLRGLPAIIFQHEIDHLDGVLFVDKVVGETRVSGTAI